MSPRQAYAGLRAVRLTVTVALATAAAIVCLVLAGAYRPAAGLAAGLAPTPGQGVGSAAASAASAARHALAGATATARLEPATTAASQPPAPGVMLLPYHSDDPGRFYLVPPADADDTPPLIPLPLGRPGFTHLVDLDQGTACWVAKAVELGV
jgi:hypothetical protein